MAGKRILLVDDHPIVREGLAQLINGAGDLSVCGEAEDAPGALVAFETLKPDLAIVDISLQGVDGLELIKQARVRWPGLLFLALSMHGEELYAERALRAGARGYIMKHEATRGVLTAIRQVLAGSLYLSPAMQARLLRRMVSEGGDVNRQPIDALSDRELAVFKLIGQGTSTREISDHLGLSVKTVESYRDHIKKKLNLRNATHLVQYAAQWVEHAQSDA